jgi:hypothetical protein
MGLQAGFVGDGPWPRGYRDPGCKNSHPQRSQPPTVSPSWHFGGLCYLHYTWASLQEPAIKRGREVDPTLPLARKSFLFTGWAWTEVHTYFLPRGSRERTRLRHIEEEGWDWRADLIQHCALSGSHGGNRHSATAARLPSGVLTHASLCYRERRRGHTMGWLQVGCACLRIDGSPER